LFTWLADAAENRIRYDDGFSNIVLALIQAYDIWKGGNMIFANRSTTKPAGGMGGAITMDAVHKSGPPGSGCWY
jgi:hypothetical protein